MIYRVHVYMLILLLAGCAGAKGSIKADRRDPRYLSGGEGTVFNVTDQAFTLPDAHMPVGKIREFTFGNRLFNTNWVVAPSSTTKFDGLGPTFNRVSCSACHTFDGRGRPPEEGKRMESMLVRISLPGQGEHGGVVPHPSYGDQINDRSIPGVPAEGRVTVYYSQSQGQYPDGTRYALRVPRYEFDDLAFGPLGKDILFSPRVAPAVFGLGLLEAVNEATILQFAHDQQGHPDGVSGKPNYVWDVVERKPKIGRFGWKANRPSIAEQNAGALLGDLGITNPIFPKENITDVQVAAKAAPTGGTPELDEDFFAKLVFYSRTLGVPARRDVDNPQVIEGEKTFKRIGCTACHIPTMTTGNDAEVPQLANQTIHPYTDLLLHDMGDGLADGRPDFQASGNEWRTPPLWGIGLVKTVNKHTFFLHDGRARNLEEAILWHGGEANISKTRFKQLTQVKRDAVLRFLESL